MDSFVINTYIPIESVGLVNLAINLAFGLIGFGLTILIRFALSSHIILNKFGTTKTNRHNEYQLASIPFRTKNQSVFEARYPLDVAELFALSRTRNEHLQDVLTALINSQTARRSSIWWIVVWAFAIGSLRVAILLNTSTVRSVVATIPVDLSFVSATAPTTTAWLSTLQTTANIFSFFPSNNFFVGEALHRPRDASLARAVFGISAFGSQQITFRHARLGQPGTVLSCPAAASLIPAAVDPLRAVFDGRQECLLTTAACTNLNPSSSFCFNGTTDPFCFSGVRVGGDIIFPLNWTNPNTGTLYQTKEIQLFPGQIIDYGAVFLNAAETAAYGGINISQPRDPSSKEFYGFFFSGHQCDFSTVIIETNVRYSQNQLLLEPSFQSSSRIVAPFRDSSQITSLMSMRDREEPIYNSIWKNAYAFCAQHVFAGDPCTLTDYVSFSANALISETLFPNDSQALLLSSTGPPIILASKTEQRQFVGIDGPRLIAVLSLMAWPLALASIVLLKNVIRNGAYMSFDAGRFADVEEWMRILLSEYGAANREYHGVFSPLRSWLREHGSLHIGTEMHYDGSRIDGAAENRDVLIPKVGMPAKISIPSSRPSERRPWRQS
ncbi:hypothetical protein BJ742DRAFT_743384 [Cladochytrium replicatum]|nr:hypothetical protein BJ742DRAFT_743384 [Cladochytrium replicatum]